MSVWKQKRFDLFYSLITSSGYAVETLAKPPFAWALDLTGLNEDSVIYSAGIGQNIDFEILLSQRTRATVHLFDPTATAEKTMQEPRHQKLLPNYHRFGLWHKTENLSFALNPRHNDGSYSVLQPGQSVTEPLLCRSIPDVMRELGHSHIDLLKLDIEGCEYEVLRSICRQRLDIHQICVEFHHNMYPNLNRWHTVLAIMRLLTRGYRLIHVTGWDHTFIHPARNRSAMASTVQGS